MTTPEKHHENQQPEIFGYYSDSRPKEPKTDLRQKAISTFIGDCVVSFDTTIIHEGIKKLFPVLEQERDETVHQNATNGIVGLIYILRELETDGNKRENIAKQTINSLSHSRSNMSHAQEAIQRIQNVLNSTYKPYIP